MAVRLLGFPGATVPALRIDGRRVQGSLEISRFLDSFVASRPLFPAEPEARRAVEEAERWGEQTLQPIPAGCSAGAPRATSTCAVGSSRKSWACRCPAS